MEECLQILNENEGLIIHSLCAWYKSIRIKIHHFDCTDRSLKHNKPETRRLHGNQALKLIEKYVSI